MGGRIIKHDGIPQLRTGHRPIGEREVGVGHRVHKTVATEFGDVIRKHPLMITARGNVFGKPLRLQHRHASHQRNGGYRRSNAGDKGDFASVGRAFAVDRVGAHIHNCTRGESGQGVRKVSGARAGRLPLVVGGRSRTGAPHQAAFGHRRSAVVRDLTSTERHAVRDTMNRRGAHQRQTRPIGFTGGSLSGENLHTVTPHVHTGFAVRDHQLRCTHVAEVGLVIGGIAVEVAVPDSVRGKPDCVGAVGPLPVGHVGNHDHIVGLTASIPPNEPDDLVVVVDMMHVDTGAFESLGAAAQIAPDMNQVSIRAHDTGEGIGAFPSQRDIVVKRLGLQHFLTLKDHRNGRRGHHEASGKQRTFAGKHTFRIAGVDFRRQAAASVVGRDVVMRLGKQNTVVAGPIAQQIAHGEHVAVRVGRGGHLSMQQPARRDIPLALKIHAVVKCIVLGDALHIGIVL